MEVTNTSLLNRKSVSMYSYKHSLFLYRATVRAPKKKRERQGGLKGKGKEGLMQLKKKKLLDESLEELLGKKKILTRIISA